MATTFLSGDVLQAFADHAGPRALAFAADCNGSMSAGVAAAVKKQWPAFADAFLVHATAEKLQPGDVFAWTHEHRTLFALALARDAAKPKFSALQRALETALTKAVETGVHTLLVPRLGGGASGLDWTRVRRLLIELGTGSPAQITVFEKFVRTKPTE